MKWIFVGILGNSNILMAHENLNQGETEFELRSISAMKDGQVHGLYDYQK